MNPKARIVIVTALIAAVGAVVALKNQAKRPDSLPVASLPPASLSSESASVVRLDTPTTHVAEANPSAPPGSRKGLPRLVDLGADKCIPCKMMAPILEALKKDYAGRLQVEFVDVWKDPSAADTYNIQVIPTQIFYDANGKELFRHEGFYSREDILKKWRELGVQ